jgi:hypothetical protein
MCTVVHVSGLTSSPVHSTKLNNTKVLASVVQTSGLDKSGVPCPVVQSSFVEQRTEFWTTAGAASTRV